MADAYAQATGNAAFVSLHSAAGLGNGLGTLYTAFRNQSPLIVTAGQQTRHLLPYDPYLGAERPTEFPRPYVRWTCEPARAEDVPLAIAQAYAILRTERLSSLYSHASAAFTFPVKLDRVVEVEIRAMSILLPFDARISPRDAGRRSSVSCQ